jgi:hypothetical protein
MTKLSVGLVLAGVLASGSAFAHHAAATLGTVTIAQPVMAGGTMLQPGTYELRDTGEHGKPLPGQSAEAQAWIEFLSNGTVVARDLAEVMSGGAEAVGTSGVTSGGTSSRVRAQLLRGGDYMRVSVTRGGERYLIHLPVQAK